MPFSLTVCVESMLFLFEMEFPSYESIGISNIVQTIQYIERQIRSYQLVANCWNATRVVVKLLSNFQIVMENCNVSVIWCASAQTTSSSPKPNRVKKKCLYATIVWISINIKSDIELFAFCGITIPWSFDWVAFFSTYFMVAVNDGALAYFFYHSLLLLLLSS